MSCAFKGAGIPTALGQTRAATVAPISHAAFASIAFHWHWPPASPVRLPHAGHQVTAGLIVAVTCVTKLRRLRTVSLLRLLPRASVAVTTPKGRGSLAAAASPAKSPVTGLPRSRRSALIVHRVALLSPCTSTRRCSWPCHPYRAGVTVLLGAAAPSWAPRECAQRAGRCCWAACTLDHHVGGPCSTLNHRAGGAVGRATESCSAGPRVGISQ
jgi:hypothetical protein